MTRQMAPELRDSFILIAPMIKASEAWRDISDREQQVTQLAYASKAADAQQKRSEAQFAARLFAAAAVAAEALPQDRIMVSAQFGTIAVQQAAVPRRSRAAALGAQYPMALGDEVLRLISDMKGAASLSTLQVAVKEALMCQDADAELVVSDAIAPPPMGSLRSMVHKCSRAAGTGAGGNRGTAQTAPAAVAAAQQRTQAVQLDKEATLLLQQVASLIQGVNYRDRVQTHAQFEKGAPVPISVPAASKAATLDPPSLGHALLQATRTAPTLAAARSALNALMMPFDAVVEL